MGFFDEEPQSEPEPEPPRPRHPWEPPEGELPGIVPIDALQLGSSEQAVVAITGISAFTQGYEIQLTSYTRPSVQEARKRHDPVALASRLMFRLGLQLSDGTKVIAQFGRRGPLRDHEPGKPVLQPLMFGGSGINTHVSRWWAWPLPPEGPLAFVCEWSDVGIAESRAELDAALILSAADRAVRLWPEEQ